MIEIWIVMAVATAIMAHFKLLLPSYKKIGNDIPWTRKFWIGVSFHIAALIAAPVFLLMILVDKYAEGFIDGFSKGLVED